MDQNFLQEVILTAIINIYIIVSMLYTLAFIIFVKFSAVDQLFVFM